MAPTYAEALNWLFGAGLGASFYGLISAMPHIKDRTFDPSYTGFYVLRFVLGLIAGLILAMVSHAAFQGNELAERLGPGLIALLGGFSAEAVELVLKRLVEVLTAVVQGSGDTSGYRKEVEATARTILADANTPPAMRQSIKEFLDRLR
jgi:hypothetical protein